MLRLFRLKAPHGWNPVAWELAIVLAAGLPTASCFGPQEKYDQPRLPVASQEGSATAHGVPPEMRRSVSLSFGCPTAPGTGIGPFFAFQGNIDSNIFKCQQSAAAVTYGQKQWYLQQYENLLVECASAAPGCKVFTGERMCSPTAKKGDKGPCNYLLGVERDGGCELCSQSSTNLP